MSSSSSSAAAPDAEDLSLRAQLRLESRKKKKQLKKARAGKLAHAGGLCASDLAVLYSADLRPSIEIKMLKNQRKVESLGAEDVQSLLLWLYTLTPAPEWVFVRNKALVTGAALLLLCEAPWQPLSAACEAGEAPFLAAAGCIRTSMPRGRTWSAERRDLRPAADAMLYLSGSNAEKRKRGEPAGAAGAPPSQLPALPSAAAALSLSPEQAVRRLVGLCLRRGELAANGFPVAERCAETGALRPPARYAMTRTAIADMTAALGAGAPPPAAAAAGGAPAAGAPPDWPRLLAVDCEMCTTAAGAQLARVTVVDAAGATLLDEFVRPELPVMDYLTPFSGVTKALLDGARLGIAEVQARMLALIDGAGEGGSTGAVLVGHSLDSDLAALRLVHSRLADTSLLYPHPAGLPLRQSLRFLSRSVLGRSIQSGHGSTGHDSLEDTLATLHLLLEAHKNACLAGEEEGEGSSEGGRAAGEEGAKRACRAEVEGAAAAKQPPEEEGAPAAAAGEAGVQRSQASSASIFAAHFARAPRQEWLPPAGSPPAGCCFNCHSSQHSASACPEPARCRSCSQQGACECAGRAGRDGAPPSARPPNGGASARGVAGVVAMLAAGGGGGAGAAAGAAAATTLRVPSAMARASAARATSLFLHEGLRDRAQCGGVSLVGPVPFLQAHLCGSASAVATADGAPGGGGGGGGAGAGAGAGGGSRAALDSVLSRAAAEASRYAAHARTRGGGQAAVAGPGLVVLEATAPELPGAPGPREAGASSKDWRALDAALARWSAGLPQGTAVIVLSQARRREGAGAGGHDAVTEPMAQWGAAFAWVGGAPPPAAAAQVEGQEEEVAEEAE